MWEKQIGKIYHKTDIAENFPLHRIEIKDEKNIYLQAKLTQTFILLEDSPLCPKGFSRTTLDFGVIN